MPFHRKTDVISENDLIFVWINRSDLVPVYVDSTKTLQTRFGPFPHRDMIGKRFGSQHISSSGQGFVFLLGPSPELWAASLPHRTQIVYSPDASYIIQRIGVRPGSRVIEAGTGSGALTHQFARTVGTQGTLCTYEYHEDRFEQAKADLENHGYAPTVVVTHRNVCENGFSIEGVSLNVNAVFLDLPAPWLAVPLAVQHIDRKKLAKICCFSPCVEQVIKTVWALHDAGFERIQTIEVQARRWEGHQAMVRTVDDALGVIRDVRLRRQEGMDRRHDRLGPEAPQKKREPFNPWGKGLRVKEGNPDYTWQPVSWSESEIRSHTSYLTFAELAPDVTLSRHHK